MDRHERQARLVGSVGQERIRRAAVGVRLGGLAGEVAVRYLAGAGVGRLRVQTEDLAAMARGVDPDVAVEVGADPPDDGREDATLSGIEDPVASEVARGALTALRALRGVIGELSPTASCGVAAGKPGAS
jgi:hypothetical protein